MRRFIFVFGLIGCLLLLNQCSKKNCGCEPSPGAGNYKLVYSDSVFYLKNTDYSISPLQKANGTYTAFPDNLQIDRNTGVITITQKGTDGESQTGMWYKIKYRSTDGNQSDSTLILLSGITYLDRFYNLAEGDSIIYPIYNADDSKPIPPGNYDLTADAKFAINTANGQININECVRKGLFGSGAAGPDYKKIEIATVKYTISDNSQQATNKIDLVLYYYATLNDVPSNVSALMKAHQQLTVGLRSLPPIPTTSGAIETNLPSELSLSKPRPPCIVIISH
jgi:hypothetical protein